MEKIQSKLRGIPETMLIPLRARYLESKLPDGIIKDPKTIEILDAIGSDFSGKKEVSKGTQVGTAVRTEILDERTSLFLINNPEAIVVNLGCGLDTRFHRLDNGTVTWFDLDVPEAIELRKNFFTQTERFKFIARSAFDFSWMEQIPKRRPILIIAEGLLMYFPGKAVRRLLKNIGKAFPRAEMLIEAMSPFIANRSDSHPDLKGYDASFKWGIKSGKEIAQWGINARFLNEWFYFERHRDRWPLIVRIMTLLPAFRKGMKIIHLKFRGQ